MPVQRFAYKPLVALVAAGTAAVCLVGCGSGAKAAASGRTAYIQLTSGTYKGDTWQLFAWKQKSELCMEVLPGGDDPDHPSAKPGRPAGGGGGCAFDAADPGSSYYASAPGPGRSSFSYGPLPGRATRIKTATNEILATRPLPHGKDLPTGRYWIHLMPAGWPSKAEGTALATPQPLDAQGKKVAFHAF